MLDRCFLTSLSTCLLFIIFALFFVDINDGTHYPAYHQVCEERENWISERKLLVRDSSYSRGSENSNMKVCSPKTHYVTYATEVKGGLLDLLVSAKLSGIEVTV